MEHLRLLMGNANPQLGRDICAQLGMAPAKALVGRFNDRQKVQRKSAAQVRTGLLRRQHVVVQHADQLAV